MLSMAPHLVRSILLCASSLIPENGRISDVVFVSSMQIVVGMLAITLYAVACVLARVLCSREALSDPAFEQYDTNELTEEDDPPPRKEITRLSRARRTLRQKIHRFSAKLLLQNHPVQLQRTSSLPDIFSSSDDDTALTHKEPVGVAFGRPLFGDVASGVRAARSSQAAGTQYQPTHITNNAPPSVAPSLAPSAVPSDVNSSASQNGARNVYLEVYGLGLAVFVYFYAVDGSSMQPTLCLLVSILVLAARDTARVTDPEIELTAPEAPLLRALSLVAFILTLAAQCCLAFGVARVPSYHAAMRDGSVLRIPAPATVVDTLLAIVFPLAAPLIVGLGVGARKNVTQLQSLVRGALPTTCIAALWFLSALGAMDAEIKTTLGVANVNQTLADLVTGSHVQSSVVLLAPLIKIPAVLTAIACCISGKSLDVLTTLSLVFFAKQKNLVQEPIMRDMLVVGTVLTSFAWALCTLRYWHVVVSGAAKWFNQRRTINET